MGTLSKQTYNDAVAHALTFTGSQTAPEGFPLEDGERLYLVQAGVELIELRETPLPLMGGQSVLQLAIADAIVTSPPTPRSIRTAELVPAREAGWLVVTDRRVEFVSDDRRRVWPFEGLLDLAHDTGAPETWLVVTNHKVTAGVRYARESALEVRLAIAVGLASAQGARTALVTELRAQNPEASKSRKRTAALAARNLWIGRPGKALRWRLAQGTLTTLGSLVLLGSVLPQPPQAGEPSAAGAAQQFVPSAAPTVDEAAQVAAEQAKAAAAAHAQAVAAQQAARVAAHRIAVERAARMAAQQRAAREAAAAQAAADQAAADQAAADQAAADQAAANSGGADNCTPEYPDFCIPVLPGDVYNCGDFSQKNFTALSPDPYRLDRDGDGIACES